jgi:hypothetical protein
MTKPAVAVRFLDFPTMLIEGSISSDGLFTFEKGKSMTFTMHSDTLASNLLQKPFYVMLVNADTAK